jgi:nucleoside-diphosphate-sugar epimerase
MQAAVTGGTGFLGQAIVRLLAPQAESVRVLVRRPEDDDRIRGAGGEPIRGDLSDPAGFGALFRPDDVVFHCAARVEMTGKWEDFRRTTIEGTRRVLEAALRCGPRRFVYVSSAAVYSKSAAADGPLSASRTAARPARYNLYGRSKTEAERVVRSECQRAGCSWVILRPVFIYGPGNRVLVRNFSRLLPRGRLFIIGSGKNRISTAYIDDSAEAVVLAGLHPKAHGKTYDIASDEAVSQIDFVNATADALDMPRPQRHIPVRLAFAAAWAADVVARLPGREMAFTRAMVDLMSTDQAVDTRLIREELGWQHKTRFAEGMRRMREWYRTSLIKEDSGNPDAARDRVLQSA